MAMIGKSPATVSTTAFTFPERVFDRLLIRLIGAVTCYIQTDGTTASSTNYSHTLVASGNEALELLGANFKTGADISIVCSGSGTVVWSMT